MKEKSLKFKSRLEQQRKYHQEKIDQFNLRAVDKELEIHELNNHLKQSRESYESLRDRRDAENEKIAASRVSKVSALIVLSLQIIFIIQLEESIIKINQIKKACADYKDMYVKLLFEMKHLVSSNPLISYLMNAFNLESR